MALSIDMHVLHMCIASGDLFDGVRAFGWRFDEEHQKQIPWLTLRRTCLQQGIRLYLVAITRITELSTSVSHLHGWPCIKLAIQKLSVGQRMHLGKGSGRLQKRILLTISPLPVFLQRLCIGNGKQISLSAVA